MNTIKIIKTEEAYQAALAHLAALMDAVPGSPQEDELELLALLVEKYEAEHFPSDPPSPVEAILFRMEQQGLTPRDMIQYLGSQSKVSEVLNGKRPLSLNMIRSLHEGLGIPLAALIQKPRQPGQGASSQALDLRRTELFSSRSQTENSEGDFVQWQARALARVSRQMLPTFDWKSLDKKLFRELAALSSYSAGPQMAGELLNRCGIHLVVQRIAHEVDLDGACFFTPENHPVLSLTLRSDRLELFWFTLFHLLAHLYLHQGNPPAAYFNALRCFFDPAPPAEEKRIHAWLRRILAPPGPMQARIRSCLATGSTAALQQAILAADTSPELISCWLRLETGEAAEELLPYQPRKISEKLEIYE